MKKKTVNKITVAILVLLSFFCLSAKGEVKCDDAKKPEKLFEKCENVKGEYEEWGKKQSFCQGATVCSQLKIKAGKADELNNENKALKLKVAEIEKKDKELKSEIDNLKRTAGNTSELLKAERKKFEEEKRTLEQEKKELEEEKRRLAAQNGKNKKEAGEAKDEIREKDSEIETLKGEKQKLQSDLDIAQDKITKLENENKTLKEKPTDGGTKWIFALIFGFLLGCAVLVFVYTKLQPKKHKSEENEESRYNSSDMIAEKVAGKLAQTFSNLKMTINSLPKQTSEQTVKLIVPVIKQQLENSNITANQHIVETTSIPSEPEIKTYYARMVGERFESSGERNAWFILKDDGNTITFDLINSCKKDRRTMNEEFKVLSQCFENYDTGDRNAVLETIPGRARRDDEEHWRVIKKGEILH